MRLPLIDSHAHLTADGVYEDIDAILERAKSKGITRIINICTDEKTLQRGLRLIKKYPWVQNTAATTPHDVANEGESFFKIVKAEAEKGTLIGIGETGLDYYYEHSPKEIQKDFLKRYLHLALEKELPVVIHCRDAFDDFFKIIEAEYPSNKGVLHCFTGTFDEAKELIKRGWYVSLSGIITFKRSDELREVAKATPLEQLLIETDTPYLAPQAFRGKRNEPAFVGEICTLIAQLKETTPLKIALTTQKNLEELFKT